jgi:hypothetical protein
MRRNSEPSNSRRNRRKRKYSLSNQFASRRRERLIPRSIRASAAATEMLDSDQMNWKERGVVPERLMIKPAQHSKCNATHNES